jgi:hypothetical protein
MSGRLDHNISLFIILENLSGSDSAAGAYWLVRVGVEGLNPRRLGAEGGKVEMCS